MLSPSNAIPSRCQPAAHRHAQLVQASLGHGLRPANPQAASVTETEDITRSIAECRTMGVFRRGGSSPGRDKMEEEENEAA